MRVLAPLLLLAGMVVTGCSDGSDGPERTEEAPASEAPQTPAPRPTLEPLPESPEPTTRTKKPQEPLPPVVGADMSWPQCPKGMGIPEKRSLGAPLPLDTAEFVILGLTNGPGFTPNPCLPDMVEWVRERGLMVAAYAVGSYPDEAAVEMYGGLGPFDGSTRDGALANTGYQQARYNVTSMLRTGLETPVVWIDVEPVPDFEWSADRDANAAVVRGLARGYRAAGYRIGIYSTPLLWEGVVGDLSLGVPEWRAAGETSMAEALNRCGDDWVIQGGPSVMGQWVEDNRDHNVTCPGTADEMEQWFHRY
ncbi:MAG TPA: hypothetical protein VFO49_08635 [Nocardioides sp.]|nr:hypothetical protein [Nocardioides sp.]